MTITRIALGILGLLVSAACACAQQGVIVATGLPADPTAPAYPQGPHSPSKWHAELDPNCMPDCYGYNRLAVPYELSFRAGPSFIIGGNRFDAVLNTGIAVELAAKGFCYNADHSRAWTLTMGLMDLYNTADETVSTMRRENDMQVLINGFLPVDVVNDYGIEYLNRQYISLAAGHEWYVFSSDPCGLRYAFGVDAGGRVGHAHAQLALVNRALSPPPGPDDAVSTTDIPEFHVTDTIGGMFASYHAGMFYSRWGYDIYLGVRGEVSRDWIKIVDADQTIDQASLLFEFGVRY